MKIEKDGLEDRLGAILEPSWADLGPLRSPKSCSRPGRGSFFENSRFRTSKVSRGNMGRTYAKMEPKREPKWSPKASQDGAKKKKKSESEIKRAFGSFRGEKKK